MKVLIDTNILVRLTLPADIHHLDAASSVQRLRESGTGLHVVPQVLYEFWVVATRPAAQNGLGFSARRAEEALDQIQQFLPLLRDERLVFDHWHQLVSKYSVIGKPAHDARLVAAMLRHGLTHVLTFNGADFSRFSEIAVLDPQVVVSQIPADRG